MAGNNPFSGVFDKQEPDDENQPVKSVASNPFKGVFEKGYKTPTVAPVVEKTASPTAIPGVAAVDREEKISAVPAKPKDTFLKKAARVVLPRSVEESIGIAPSQVEGGKVSEAEAAQARESARMSYVREKQKQEVFQKAGLPADIEENPDKYLPPDYVEPQGFWGQLKEAAAESYLTTVRPTIATMKETMGATPEQRTLGREKADALIAEAMKRVELAAPKDMPTFFSGGIVDKRWYGRTIGSMLPYALVTVGASTAAALAATGVGAPAATAATAATVAAFGATYAVEKSSAYRQMLDRGIAPDKAAYAADIYGLTAAKIEQSFGLKPGTIGAGIVGVIEETAEQAAKRKVANSYLGYLSKNLPRYSASFLKKMGEEGGEEAAQQFAQNLATKWYDGSQGLWEGVAESLAQGAVGSLGFAPMEVAGGVRTSAAGYVKERARQSAAEKAAPVETATVEEPAKAAPAAPEDLTDTEQEPMRNDAKLRDEVLAATQELQRIERQPETDPEGTAREAVISRINVVSDELNAEMETSASTPVRVEGKAALPLLEIRTVRFDDGKWAYSLSASTSNGGVNYGFVLEDLSGTQDEAIAKAKKNASDWVAQEKNNLTSPTDRAQLAKISKAIASAKRGTPKAEISETISAKQKRQPVNDTWKMSREEAASVLGAGNMDLRQRAIAEALDLGLTPHEGWREEYPELSKQHPETQKEKVKKTVAEEPKSIREIAEQTGILEPNVRRILGVGEKEGEFTRIDKGVYVLKKDGQELAYIQTGDAREVLPKLAESGRRFDMVFLDIPYKTKGVTGGNRGIDFDTISPDEFGTGIVEPVKKMLRDDSTPVVYMYSNSKTGAKDMVEYTKKLYEAGFQAVAKGTYTKTYKNGKEMKFGAYPMPPEGIIVFNQSGDNKTKLPDSFDFRFVAPLYKGHYQTEKAAELLEAIIKGTTEVGGTVLDPFAGSGVAPAEAVKAGRKAVAIEKSEKAVEERIKPRVEEAAKTVLIGTEKQADGTEIVRQNEVSPGKKTIEQEIEVSRRFSFGGKEFAVGKPDAHGSLTAWRVNDDGTLSLPVAESVSLPSNRYVPLPWDASNFGEEVPNGLFTKLDELTGTKKKKEPRFAKKAIKTSDYETAYYGSDKSVKKIEAGRQVLGKNLTLAEPKKQYGEPGVGRGFVYVSKNREVASLFGAAQKIYLRKDLKTLDPTTGRGSKEMVSILEKADVRNATAYIGEYGVDFSIIDAIENPEISRKIRQSLLDGGYEAVITQEVDDDGNPFGSGIAILNEYADSVKTEYEMAKEKGSIRKKPRFAKPRNLKTGKEIKMAEGSAGTVLPRNSTREEYIAQLKEISPQQPERWYESQADQQNERRAFLPTKAEPPTKGTAISGGGAGAGFAFAPGESGTEYYNPPGYGKEGKAEITLRGIQFPELVEMTRELKINLRLKKLKKYAGYFRGDQMEPTIVLIPGLFDDIRRAEKVLAHELGHAADWLPDKTLKRGHLVNRIYVINREMAKTWGEKDIKNKEVVEELKNLTMWWTPFDPDKVPDGYRKYRFSSKELYAEALSVLLNSPGDALERAPKFFKGFFEHLDAKPEVKETYFGLQEMLAGGKPEVVKKRMAAVEGMLTAADYKAIELERARQAARDLPFKDRMKKLAFDLRFEFMSKATPFVDRIEEAKKRGITLNEDDNALYAMSTRNYVGGIIDEMLSSKVAPTLAKLEDLGVGRKELSKMLFFERIAYGDRGNVANPLGLAPEYVKELMGESVEGDESEATVLENSMRAQLGEQTYQEVRRLSKELRDALKSLYVEGHAEGIYADDVLEMVNKNDFYTPFKTAAHIGEYTTARIKKQVGTFSDIEDPIATLVEKMVSIKKSVVRNQTNRIAITTLRTVSPEDLIPAKSRFVNNHLEIIETKDRGMGTVWYFVKGKVVGYHVEEYLAKSINNDSIALNRSVAAVLRMMNAVWFRPVYITFNLGFQSFNVIRDFMRYWRNTPDLSIYGALDTYRQAWKHAAARGFDMDDALISEMKREGVLSATFNDLIKGADGDDTQVEGVLRKYNLGKPGRSVFDRNRFTREIGRPVLAVGNFITNLGDTLESMPKVASYLYFKGKTGQVSASERHFIRRFVGSPDFLEKGYWTANANAIFLFSNSIIQATRSDFAMATDPKTRAGFWWKTAKSTLLPKVLMFAALKGAFGEILKDVMEEATEYDKTNYIIVPLGKTENRKAAYLRLPQDEAVRLIGGLFWKAMKIGVNKDPEGVLEDVFSLSAMMAGQLPTLTPAITIPIDVYKFVSGQPVYDDFRQRNVLTEDQQLAGWKHKAKPVLTYLWNESGGSIFAKIYAGEPTEPLSGWEKVLRLPLLSNVVGRFIKITDFGQSEVEDEAARPIEREAAERRLEDKTLVAKYAREAKKQGIGRFGAEKLEDEMVREALGHDPESDAEDQRAKSLITKFRNARKWGVGDNRLEKVNSFGTLAEKAKYIRGLKSKMSDGEYQDLIDLGNEEGIISDNLLDLLED